MEKYETEKEYFKEAILFFDKFKWLYNMPVTQILFDGCLNLFPKDWIDALIKLKTTELNNFVCNAQVQSNWPMSLKIFIENCKKLNKMPLSKICNTPTKLPEAFMKNLSVKKQHEIFYLTQVIHEKCISHNIKLIVDFGAGLGYICQLLNHLHGYQVLGIESNEKNVKKAEERQKAFFPESLSSVKYTCHNITENSSTSIEMLLKNEFGNSQNICLIGLHACGDLSIFMSKIYLEIPAAKLLILVSCCYHKLSLRNDDQKKFDNEKKFFNYFPLSENAKKAFDDINIDTKDLFNRPFMRLACQETADRWFEMLESTHEEHSFYVLARAILELYSAQNGYQLKKLTRKGTRKSQCKSFEIYLEDCTKRYIIEKKSDDDKKIYTVSWNDQIKNEIKVLWENQKDKQKIVELFTALQLLIQQAAESFILMDRIDFLTENDCKVYLTSIMNKSLSPRNCGLVANK